MGVAPPLAPALTTQPTSQIPDCISSMKVVNRIGEAEGQASSPEKNGVVDNGREKEVQEDVPMTATRPRLTQDLMNRLAEKIVFSPPFPSTPFEAPLVNDVVVVTRFSPSNEFRLDMRELKNCKFLFVCQSLLEACLKQLARLSTLYAGLGGLELRGPLNQRTTRRDPLDPRQMMFQGPFNVRDHFLFDMFMRDVPRFKSIQTYGAFSSADFSDDGRVYDDQEDLGRESAVVSLMKMLLFKNDPKVIYELLEENDVSELRLFLDLVTMDDKAPLFRHFNRICNLDPKELQFEIRETLANCEPIAFRPVCSNRVQRASLTYNVTVESVEEEVKLFPYEHAYSVLQYVADSCPNICRKVMRFKLMGEISVDDFPHMVSWLRETILRLADELPKRVFCRSDVVVAFRTFFPERKLKAVRREPYALSDVGVEDQDPWEEDGEASNSIAPGSFTLARRLEVPLYPYAEAKFAADNDDGDGEEGKGKTAALRSKHTLTLRCFLVGTPDDDDEDLDNHDAGPLALRYEVADYDQLYLLLSGDDEMALFDLD